MRNEADYDRVTQVLSFLTGLHKVPKEILEAACERGKRVHQNIAALMNSLPILNDEPALEGYIESYNQWAFGKEFMPTPERFYCDELKITGECDGIYKEQNDLVLVDYKTPLKESPTWGAQLSAYHNLAEKNGYKIKRIEAVKLRKDGKAPTVYTYTPNMEHFLQALTLYRVYIKGSKEDFLEDL